MSEIRKNRGFLPPPRFTRIIALYLKEKEPPTCWDGATEEQRGLRVTRKATRELFLRRATDRSFFSRLGRARPFLTTTPLHSGLVSDLRGTFWGARFGRQKRRELSFLSLSYLILGWTRLFILVVSINLHHYHYLLTQKKTNMDVSQYIDLPASWIISLLFFLLLLFIIDIIFFNFFLFIPTEGDEMVSGMSGSTFATKTLLPFGERTSVAFPKSCVRMKSVCVREAEKGRRKKRRKKHETKIPVLWFHICPFWEVFLFFIAGSGGRGFLVLRYRCVFADYQMDTSLFFSSTNVRTEQIEGLEPCVRRKKKTLWTCGWPLFLTDDRRWTRSRSREHERAEVCVFWQIPSLGERWNFLFFLLIVGTESCQATALIGQA